MLPRPPLWRLPLPLPLWNLLLRPLTRAPPTPRRPSGRARSGSASTRYSTYSPEAARVRTNPREFTPRLDADGNPVPKAERRPKKKVACMIGYCGTGYNGMQIQNPNPDVKTIEGDLFKAFVAAGAISRDNADDLKKNGFMRAARTDKGVHAAGNVVLAKLIVEDDDIVAKINAALPAQIRVWGIERTNKLFDCRKMCLLRVYEYLLPTYSLLPPKPKTVLAQLLAEARRAHPGVLREDEEGEQWWRQMREYLGENGVTEDDLVEMQRILEGGRTSLDQDGRVTLSKPVAAPAAAGSEATGSEAAGSETAAAADATAAAGSETAAAADATTDAATSASTALYDSLGNITPAGSLVKRIKSLETQRRRQYAVSPSRLELFRDAMRRYEGLHNFHNFTLGKSFKDPSARRFMKHTTVSDPFVIEGTEWVSIKIHGQLFMLHQIRKMIAMAVLVVRTGCPLDRISEAFGPTKINIPKAPALGLLLEAPVYESYNQLLEKYGYNHIDFSKYQAEMDAFKMKYIYDKIYAEEVKENVFYGFFAFIDTFRGNGDTKEGRHIFDFLGPVFESESLKERPAAAAAAATEAAEAAEAQPQDNID